MAWKTIIPLAQYLENQEVAWPDLAYCARNCARQLPGRVLEIPEAHDMVAVED